MPQSIALLNPTARSGKSARFTEQNLLGFLNGCELIRCQSAGEIEAQAHAAAKQNIDTIIAIGGDGTIHHAANGILRAENTTSALAVIPNGTANDYWATLRHYPSEKDACELLVDVGQIRQGDFHRYFVNVLGIGFSAEAAAAAAYYKNWSPRLRYLLGVLAAVRHQWILEEALLKLDHQSPRQINLFMLSVAKGSREGSFTLVPQAMLDDGFLHLTIASDLLRRDVFRYLPGVCLGKLPKSDPRIRIETARRVSLTTTRPLRFHLDGELLDVKYLKAAYAVEINVLPKRLRVKFIFAQER